MICFLQSKVSRYSFRAFDPPGLCDESRISLLFLTKSLSLPDFISLPI